MERHRGSKKRDSSAGQPLHLDFVIEVRRNGRPSITTDLNLVHSYLCPLSTLFLEILFINLLFA